MFEYIDHLNRGWDARILESQSPRSVFVWSMVIAFLVGGEAVTIAYGIITHRVDWPIVLNLIFFATLGSRYARILYRRLGATAQQKPEDI